MKAFGVDDFLKSIRLKLFLFSCVFAPESDSEVPEELLKPGHLSRLLEEDLSGDMSCLSLAEVIGVMESLLERLRSYRDKCSARHLGVSFFLLYKYFFSRCMPEEDRV